MVSEPARPTLVSVTDAAQILGENTKPWDVIRLIEDRQIDFSYLVDLDSLLVYAEQASA